MMTRLRHLAHFLVAAALYYSGALATRCWLHRLGTRRPEVAVLGLHRILTAEQAALASSESAMVVMLPTFRKLLQTLKEQFHVLTLSDFLRGDIPLGPKPNCLLTFDDAWCDTYENAYPALQKAGLSAAVFVPTGLVGSEGFFWVERLSVLWRNCGKNCVELGSALGRELDQAPVETLEASIAVLKCVPAVRRESILRALAAQFSGDSPNAIDTFMSWDQLLEMSPVVEAASHTVHHVLLDQEEEAVAKRELAESRETLRLKTGRESRALAYPSGSFNERVRGWVADAGYLWAFTVRAGIYGVGHDPLTVPRTLLQEGNITSPWGEFSPAMFHFRLTGWR
jgi:peptidoglycan/xylan/chitin deacetylase (PgdA/CDA1 family)